MGRVKSKVRHAYRRAGRKIRRKRKPSKSTRKIRKVKRGGASLAVKVRRAMRRESAIRAGIIDPGSSGLMGRAIRRAVERRLTRRGRSKTGSGGKIRRGISRSAALALAWKTRRSKYGPSGSSRVSRYGAANRRRYKIGGLGRRQSRLAGHRGGGFRRR